MPLATSFASFKILYDLLKYECTPVFFELSRSFKPASFEEKIGLLFDSLGMPKDKIPLLFQIGKMLDHPNGGTLFQFFDLSHQEPTYKNAYDFMDRLTFPSKKKGEPIFVNAALSDMFQSTYNSTFYDQYRIIVNHFEFLSPNSSISMKRYDLVDPKTLKDYELKLKQEIRAIPSNPDKAHEMREILLQYWKS